MGTEDSPQQYLAYAAFYFVWFNKMGFYTIAPNGLEWKKSILVVIYRSCLLRLGMGFVWPVDYIYCIVT
jgi:hypothetical protein